MKHRRGIKAENIQSQEEGIRKGERAWTHIKYANLKSISTIVCLRNRKDK